MALVDVRQAKLQLRRLLRRAPAGEAIVSAKAGLTIACLVPLARREPHRPGLEAFFEPLPADELAAWQQWR